MADQLFNIKLVGEIEKHPCLYNYMLNDYSRKDVTERAWKEVGRKVNLSGSQCKERWKNLRAVFVRQMKLAANSTKFMKPYYLSDAMKFALPFVKTLNPNPSGNLLMNAETQEEIDSNQEETSMTFPSEYQVPLLCTVESAPLTCTSPQSDFSSSSLPQPSPSHSGHIKSNRKRKRSHDDDIDKLIAQYIRTKKEKLEEFKDVHHESNKMFLLSLLPDINDMSRNQNLKFKKKVLDLVEEIMSR